MGCFPVSGHLISSKSFPLLSSLIASMGFLLQYQGFTDFLSLLQTLSTPYAILGAANYSTVLVTHSSTFSPANLVTARRWNIVMLVKKQVIVLPRLLRLSLLPNFALAPRKQPSEIISLIGKSFIHSFPTHLRASPPPLVNSLQSPSPPSKARLQASFSSVSQARGQNSN